MGPSNSAKAAAVERKPIVGKHREIAVRYEWLAREARKKNAWRAFGPKKYPRGSARLIALVRLRELERLFRHRYGETLPYDDAGLEDLSIAAHHIAHLRGEAFEHIVAFAARWMPQLPRRRAEALAETVLAQPRKYKAATLGRLLRLTQRERATLSITTIGAFDASATERAERKKERARERAAASYRRRQAAKPPKPEPLCRARPWDALGMSRATWFRKGKPTPGISETKPSAQQVGSPVNCYAEGFVSPAESTSRAERRPRRERSGGGLKLRDAVILVAQTAWSTRYERERKRTDGWDI